METAHPSSALPTPELSVVIVTWNRCEDLKLALQSIQAQTVRKIEVIVVDNGSTDGTSAYLRSLGDAVKVITNTHNAGACQGKNQGILAARGEFLVFMDSDAVLLEDTALATMRDYLKEHIDCGAVSGPIYHDREQQHPWVLGIHYSRFYYIDWEKTHTRFGRADALSTCFMVMRRKDALAVGGFDPVYFYQHEDLDFFIRLNRRGKPAHVLGQPPVWHRIAQHGRKVDRWFWMHWREEWRHQYLLLKNDGVWAFLRFWLAMWLHPAPMLAYYVRPMRMRKRIVLFGMMPAFMLLATPWIVWRRHRNHLKARLKQFPQGSGDTA